MDSHVCFQSTTLSKCLLAQTTLVWFLSSMGSHVCRQITTMSKWFLTKQTSLLFLSSICSCGWLHLITSSEWLSIYRSPMWFSPIMGLNVHIWPSNLNNILFLNLQEFQLRCWILEAKSMVQKLCAKICSYVHLKITRLHHLELILFPSEYLLSIS